MGRGVKSHKQSSSLKCATNCSRERYAPRILAARRAYRYRNIMASRSLKQPRADADRQREDHRVEEEGEHAVDQRQAAQLARCHLHVGDLAGHADDEGVIKEIPVMRLAAAGKDQPAFRLAIEEMG